MQAGGEGKEFNARVNAVQAGGLGKAPSLFFVAAEEAEGLPSSKLQAASFLCLSLHLCIMGMIIIGPLLSC